MEKEHNINCIYVGRNKHIAYTKKPLVFDSDLNFFNLCTMHIENWFKQYMYSENVGNLKTS